MTKEYTPTDNGIAHYAARGMDDIGICAYDEAKRRWCRWLAAHDAELQADAWDEGFTNGRDLAASGQPMTRDNPYREQEES